MMHKRIEKFIKSGELCVRCLLHPMHVRGRGKLQDSSVMPGSDDVNVSVLRHEYATEEEIVAHGRKLAANIKSKDPQELKGLLYITQNIVNSVNLWLRTSFSKLEGVDALPSNMAELKYAPMIDSDTYLPKPEEKEIYTDTPGIELPHHADLRYAVANNAECQTEVRQYGREMMKRVRYKLFDGGDGWQDDIQAGAFKYFDMQPELSIIVPFFNDRKYIKTCADSIFEEVEGKPVEVLWVGDTPTDGTAKIVTEMVALHPEYFYLYGKEHSGQGLTRNEGLKVARGRYVWFVDADDLICKGSVSLILDVIRGGHEAYMFRTEEKNEDGSKRKSTRRYAKSKVPMEATGEEVLLRHLSFAPSLMCVFKRDFLVNHRLKFSQVRNLDMDFMPRFLCEVISLQIRPEVIYTYVYHTKKGHYNEEDTRQMLEMYDHYGKQRRTLAKNDKRQRSLAYVQQMILSQIVQLPSKKQFERLNTALDISSYRGEVWKLMIDARYCGTGIVERLFWLIACLSIKRANWFSNLKFIR